MALGEGGRLPREGERAAGVLDEVMREVRHQLQLEDAYAGLTGGRDRDLAQVVREVVAQNLDRLDEVSAGSRSPKRVRATPPARCAPDVPPSSSAELVPCFLLSPQRRRGLTRRGPRAAPPARRS